MFKNWKSLLFVLLGIIVIVQSGVTVLTLTKINKLQSVIPTVEAANAQAQQQNQQQNDPGSVKSPIPVDITSAPSLGPTNASVTMVEFTDFECPFCKSVQPTIKQILKKYDGKIHFVSRNYPLGSIHVDAVNGALAGLCANEQNKYWEFHDAMFDTANGSGTLTKDVLKQIASKLDLNTTQFNSCLDSKKYIDRVQKDYEDGSSYMVSGTPTFFINNRIITGNQPIEVFEKVIDEELQKKKQSQ